ncbi:MAG: SET domain-containing protein-lysine N-methyltransferase [Hyphomicrobiaceae bacterium]
MRVALAGDMGRGVFADRAVAAGEVLGSFYTIHICAAERPAALQTALRDFIFFDEDGSAEVVLGWLSLVNHGQPNIVKSWRATQLGPVVTVTAARDLAAGEQLYFDYQFDPGTEPDWARRPG